MAPFNGRFNPWENALIRDAETDDLYGARWGGDPDERFNVPEGLSALERAQIWERIDRLCEVEGVNAHGIFPTEPPLPARDAVWDGRDWWKDWGDGRALAGQWWRRLLRFWHRYPLLRAD